MHGPSSARNVIYFMTRQDYGEAYFETLLHTPRTGTVVRDMDNYIDRTFTQYDFVDYLPSSATNVLAVVESDTWKYGYLLERRSRSCTYPQAGHPDRAQLTVVDLTTRRAEIRILPAASDAVAYAHGDAVVFVPGHGGLDVIAYPVPVGA